MAYAEQEGPGTHPTPAECKADLDAAFDRACEAAGEVLEYRSRAGNGGDAQADNRPVSPHVVRVLRARMDSGQAAIVLRVEKVQHLAVGTYGYCSPRQRVAFNSRNEGSRCTC